MSAAGFVQKYSQLCPDCGGNNFVDDHQQGDLICRVRPALSTSRPGLAALVHFLAKASFDMLKYQHKGMSM